MIDKRSIKKEVHEQINRDSIVLNGKGFFPKKLIIVECGKKLEYRIIKTRQGKYQLNK